MMQGTSLFGGAQPHPSPTARGVLLALGFYRIVTATWAVVLVVIDARSGVLDRPSIAFAVLAPVVVWSATVTWLARTQPAVLLTRPALAFDLLLGAAVIVTEWVVYDGAHPLIFGALWQLAPILSTGIALGAIGGFLAGLGFGLVNGVSGALAAGIDGRVLATLSAIVLFSVAGWAAGGIMDRLQRAEDEVAEARARERVAQTLHDGVLQTLAAIQRRSSDDELVDLAAQQDRELRRWIRGDLADQAATDFGTRLRDLASSLERRDGTPVVVVAVGEPAATPAVSEALLGAIGEAVTNAVKHGHAARVTVFVDAEDPDGLLCTVHDDGVGFDPESTAAGMGMTTSLVRPVESVGGTVAIRSSPGAGTEVELRLP